MARTYELLQSALISAEKAQDFAATLLKKIDDLETENAQLKHAIGRMSA